MRRLLQTERLGVSLAWAAVALVLAITAWSLASGRLGWTLFGVGLAAVLLVTPAAFRSAAVMPPWPVTLLVAVPFAVGAAVPGGPVAALAAYAAVAALALVVAVQVEAFTPVRMNRGFAVALVVATTVTAAGVWELGKWLVESLTGTPLVGDNEAVMWRFVSSALAGLGAGLLFDRYLKRYPGTTFVPDGFEIEDADDQVDAAGDHVSALLAAAGISDDRQRTLVRGLQLVLVAFAVGGAVTLNANVVVSAGVGLGATALPALLRRDRQLHLDVGLTLWIAVAVVLHALGTLAFYQTVWGWHKLTHAMTGTLVAGVGYTAVRAVESHTDSVSFPPRFAFVVVVLFVFAVGIFWEILEFFLDMAAAAAGTEEVVLSQHGRDDTLSDLVANTAGALLVAGAATVYRLR